MNIHIKNSTINQSQSYSLKFFNLQFFFPSTLNLKNLQYFCQQNQQKLGKIQIKINIDYLKNMYESIKNVNYIILTEYQQILAVPYIMRNVKNKENVRIIGTKSILQEGKIYAIDFYECIRKINQISNKLTFEQQSQTADNYEVEYNLNLQQWIPIWKKSELLQCFDKMVGINYSQIYDTERGAKLVPFPSGVNIGSACWLFQNTMTKQRLLWIQGLSHHQWRACRPFAIPHNYTKIQHIVFTANSLCHTQNPQNDQLQCLQFLKMLFFRLNLNKGHNSKIILQDMLVICDIINYIVYQFNEKFKQLFITGSSANKMMCYTNSLVEYLADKHRRRIYEQIPAYPFQSYQDLKNKKIHEGTLQQISQKQRIPLKQLLLRSTPYLHFQSDYHAYLHQQFGSVHSQNIFTPRVNLPKLKQFLQKLQSNANIIYYCRQQEDVNKLTELTTNDRLTLLPINQQWSIQQTQTDKYYTSQGQITGLLGEYKKCNGWLYLQSMSRIYRILDGNWINIICSQIDNVVVQRRQQESSENIMILLMNDYKLQVECKDQQILLKIQGVLQKITKIVKIR